MLGLTIMIGYQQQSIDSYVHRYHLRFELSIADHGANNTFASANQNARGSIHIVYPARQRLRDSGRNCAGGINII